MEKPDDSLKRLFRAAALASKEVPARPPSDLKNQVIAEWRNAGIEDEFGLLVNLFRRAVVFASCIMVLSINWSWMQSSHENASETALADYALNMQLPP